MTIEIRAASVHDAADLAQLLVDVDWGGGPIIVKPNWFSGDPGNYTEARTLDLVLGVLPRPAIVVEAYTGPRDYGGREDIPTDVAGAKAHRAWIAAQDRRWLATSGMDAVLSHHGAEYVNATEEVWDGRVTPVQAVQAVVEERFGPVPFPVLYRYVPQRLFDLRGSTFLSLARIKGAFSLSCKNLFGLIPDPLRLRWHGDDDSRLGASIVSMNLIYGALFRVVGLCEAIYQAVRYHDAGAIHVPWGRYDVIEGVGVVAWGTHLPSLDAYVARLVGASPADVVGLDELAERLGSYEPGLEQPVPPDLAARFQ